MTNKTKRVRKDEVKNLQIASFTVNIIEIDNEIYAVSNAALDGFLLTKVSDHETKSGDKIKGVGYQLIASEVPIVYHKSDDAEVN